MIGLLTESMEAKITNTHVCYSEHKQATWRDIEEPQLPDMSLYSIIALSPRTLGRCSKGSSLSGLVRARITRSSKSWQYQAPPMQVPLVAVPFPLYHYPLPFGVG